MSEKSIIKEINSIIRAGKQQYKRAITSPRNTLYLREYGEVAGNTWNFNDFTEKDREKNLLIQGDNKNVMGNLIEKDDVCGKIKLIYIDPPFFSKADYDAMVKCDGENIKHKAYEDTWSLGMKGYLKMLTARLLLMKDLLADDGLIWVHLDFHAVHYVRIIMDEIFGADNFVNEIIWHYKSGGSTKRRFSRKHDNILVYSKSKKYRFFPLEEKSYNRDFKPYRFKGVEEFRDEIGWYTMVNMKDVWEIDMVGRTSKERTGYATQKPEALLERVIESCTEPGDLCADFFCGSGTFGATAAKLGRNFIMCDQGSLAVETTAARLIKESIPFTVYDQKKNRRSNLNCKVSVKTVEDLDDKRLISIDIQGLSLSNHEDYIDSKSLGKIREIENEDSLKLLMSWSVDFNYNGRIFNPERIYVRDRDEMATHCENIVLKDSRICVKVTDIFGQTQFVYR